tara:strand:+ start:3308 stop:3529 length:222 start_codon:yes stop_codon:yes gene_type:complete
MSLLGKKPSDTYKSLMKVGGSANQTLDTALRTIEDGLGNDSALSISTTTVKTLDLEVDGNITGSTLDGGTYST